MISYRNSFKEEIEDYDLPEWFQWSCEQISYMFPKAHCIECVQMSWKFAWFKVNYPEVYNKTYNEYKRRWEEEDKQENTLRMRRLVFW